MILSRPGFRGGLYVVLALLALGSISIRKANGVDYSLRVDPAGYAIKYPLERATEGLGGGHLTSLYFQEGQPRNVVAIGPHAAYVSTDEGASWSPLGHDGRPWSEAAVLWREGEPLRVLWMGTLWTTRDLGRTWESWSLEYPGPQLDRFSGLDLIASETNQEGQTTYFQVDLGSSPPGLGAEIPAPVESSRESVKVSLEGNTYEGYLFPAASGGEWLACPVGVYRRGGPQEPWESRNAGIENPSIVRLSQSPTQSESLAALDSGGRLFLSDDFGEHWKFVPGPSLISVRFDSQGRLLQTEAEGRVFRDQESVGPSPDRLREVLVEMTEERYPSISKESLEEVLGRFQFQDSGVTQEGKLWILTCSIGASRQLVGDPFKTPAGDWALNLHGMPDYYQVLLQTDQGWQLLRGGQALEALTEESPPDLRFDWGERELLFKSKELDSAHFFVGLVARADWLEAGRRYLLMGEDGIQIGSVSGGWPAKIWSWGYVMNEDSLRYGNLRCAQAAFLKEEGRLRFLIPSSNGIWKGEVPLGPTFHWRAPIHFVAYSWLFWLLWSAALLALWVSRPQSPKQ